MQAELEQLLNRKIDLISKRGIQASCNPLRYKAILDSVQVIHANKIYGKIPSPDQVYRAEPGFTPPILKESLIY